MIQPLQEQKSSFSSRHHKLHYWSYTLDVRIFCFNINTIYRRIVLPWALRCSRLFATCVWRTSRDVRWNVLHTHHAGENDTSRIQAVAVLLKAHAQEFTDHLNRIDKDNKLTTEGEVITHTSRDEEWNIDARTKRALAFLDTWSVVTSN